MTTSLDLTTRLNLICSGMMLFNEVDDRLQIVIPDAPGHIRGFCKEPQPAKGNIRDLPIGAYKLDVPVSNRGKLADLLDASGYLLLDGSRVGFNEQLAKTRSAIIDVPKPSIIRLFRPSEPLKGFDLLGNCHNRVARIPTVVHDFIVLSYKDVPTGKQVKIGPPDGEPLATATTAPLTTINWMLYSNERQPFASEPSSVRLPDEMADTFRPLQSPSTASEFFIKVPELALNDALKPLRHATTINAFLEVRDEKGRVSAPTTLSLSGIGKRDLPPTLTAIDISRLQLFLFHELPDDAGGSIDEPVCGEAGCSGGARATQ